LESKGFFVRHVGIVYCGTPRRAFARRTMLVAAPTEYSAGVEAIRHHRPHSIIESIEDDGRGGEVISDGTAPFASM
jgi:hypothetical protein